MSGLVDMEELLSSISNKAMVEYMREAKACYNGGAYRGCIVMSYLALFDDIRTKLAELAKVNSDAKKIWIEVNKRSNEQQVFESYMVDQLKAKGLLEESKHQRLTLVNQLRNKAAHPSGVSATPEEARFIYRTVITEFLSDNLLKTTHAVDAITERLDQNNLFPSTSIGEIKDIVVSDCSELHDLAAPYLVSELLTNAGSSDKIVRSNAERYILGLARSKNPTYRPLLQKKALETYCTNAEHFPFIGRLISADANLLDGIKKISKTRINKLLTDSVKPSKPAIATRLSHPASQISSMILELGEDEFSEHYQDFFEAVLEKYPFTPTFYEALENTTALKKTVIDSWKYDAGSSTYDIANTFAKALPEIDEGTDTILNDQDAFELIAAISEAADKGAWQSKAIKKSKFSDAPNIAEAAIRFSNKKKQSAKKVLVGLGIECSLKAFVEDNLTS